MLYELDFVDLLLRGDDTLPLLRCNGGHVSKMTVVPDSALYECGELYKKCEVLRKSCKKDIFRMSHADVAYRVAAETKTINGQSAYTLRRCSDVVPTLESLELPKVLLDKLMNPALRGLILVTGPMGAGKTHLCSGLVAGKLNKFGGYARTIEDPIELPLSGTYINGDLLGVCVQSEVAQSKNGYAKALKKVVREAPDIIYIGEIRDASVAAEAVRAGLLGHTVLATMHGDNVIGALERLRSWASLTFETETPAMMSEAIVGIVNIRDQSRSKIDVLFLKDEGGAVSSVRSIIASGQFSQLISDINRQRNRLSRGGDEAIFGGPG